MHLISIEQADEAKIPQVLVVDDSASMREGISAILRHMGCHVEMARDGIEGYQKAQALSPDLILTLMEHQGQTKPIPQEPGFKISHDWVQQQVSEMLADQLPTNQVDAHIEVADADLGCREDLLRTMIRELTGNAIKFAEAKSTIRLSGMAEGNN